MKRPENGRFCGEIFAAVNGLTNKEGGKGLPVVLDWAEPKPLRRPRPGGLWPEPKSQRPLSSRWWPPPTRSSLPPKPRPDVDEPMLLGSALDSRSAKFVPASCERAKQKKIGEDQRENNNKASNSVNTEQNQVYIGKTNYIECGTGPKRQLGKTR